MQYSICLKIANALYGDQQRLEFSEKYLPFSERFVDPKVEDLASYLFNDDSIKHFWAVLDYESNVEIGYILITNLPHYNAIGYSIDVNYSNKGVMKKALRLVLDEILERQIQMPLNVYTDINNAASINLLDALHFELKDIEDDPILGTLKHYTWG